MGKKMLPVSLGLAAAVLSGCMGEAAEPVVEEVQPEAPAFHFASGTLELGDFDPATLGDDLFDPCTEISAEEYAAAGITGVESLEPRQTIGEEVSRDCSVDDLEDGITQLVSATRTNLDVTTTALANDEVDFPVSAVPGLFTHRNKSINDEMCVAQVDTRRGGLAVGFSLRGVKKSQYDPCALATGQLESLYGSSTQHR